ncbi:alpha/beta hydrolase [Thalassotalea sp. LPB0316]|uniref:alpha/beta family hydrolase n=1 Tax=Thalassotalea sp. LPB0316 TaxID=2769490 RepID=UPI00186913C7|nr:alpha/beta family hydrolase [Thalassotalea sp. LPB0316]QOL24528.1 alpha/beta hydrolase [Thalassotalea sp. LPB0316]
MSELILNNAKAPVANFVFAHGAGAGKKHSFMEKMATLLVEQGINVIRFDFPYMAKRAIDGKKYPPNKMPVLVEAYQAILTDIGTELPLFIGGKSMGSRVAMTLLGEDEHMSERVTGAICLGYPFHPPKKPEKHRLAPLMVNRVPTLICQGDRDTLGNKPEIDSYLLAAHYQLMFLPDGDHDFKPRVRSGYNQEQHLVSVAQAIRGFVEQVAGQGAK